MWHEEHALTLRYFRVIQQIILCIFFLQHQQQQQLYCYVFCRRKENIITKASKNLKILSQSCFSHLSPEMPRTFYLSSLILNWGYSLFSLGALNSNIFTYCFCNFKYWFYDILSRSRTVTHLLFIKIQNFKQSRMTSVNNKKIQRLVW